MRMRVILRIQRMTWDGSAAVTSLIAGYSRTTHPLGNQSLVLPGVPNFTAAIAISSYCFWMHFTPQSWRSAQPLHCFELNKPWTNHLWSSLDVSYIHIYIHILYIICAAYIYIHIYGDILYIHIYIYSIVSRVFMLCSKNVYVYNCIYIYIRIYRERERFVDSYTLESANLTLVHCVKFSLVTSCLASKNNGDLGDQSPQPLDHGRVANCWSFIKKSLFGVMKKTGRPRHAMITLISSP